MIDGTADLRIVNEEAKQEEFIPDEEELEIERRQEAQRIALAHGGFSDLPEFEAAIMAHAAKGGGDFHGSNGYAGLMSGHLPKKEESKDKPEDKADKPEDPIHKILKSQKEAQEGSHAGRMAATGEGKQAVFEAPASAGQPHTPAPSGSVAAPAAESATVVAQAQTAQATGTMRATDEL